MIAGVDVALVRAVNPGPLTLSGTNTWLLGRDPCWVIDPGPALDAHLDAVSAAAALRGGFPVELVEAPPAARRVGSEEDVRVLEALTRG